MIKVIKRSGKKESLDLAKFHRVVAWACEDLTGVSASEVELRSSISFYNNIKTSDIQETLIKAAADLITEDTPNYQYVAGRLINYHLRKQVFGQYFDEKCPISLYDHITAMVKKGYYDRYLLDQYTKAEWDELEQEIDHNRDFNIVYCGMEQFRNKYLVKNRVTGEIFETPQIALMLIAATLFAGYETKRLTWVKEYYDAISKFDISLPTPIMAGLRTPQRQFSSCVLIETDDSLDSINATTSAIVKYVSQKAGIGIGAGRIRAINSPIRHGDAYHTGVIPFYKLFHAAVKSCSQGGVRGGAATLYYPLWHLEVEDLLVLKNNKGTEENRIRQLDYGVQLNKLMYERLIQGGNITLFSPSDVPGLYEAFFEDQEKFRELYEAAERTPRIRKKTVPAIELFSTLMQERKDTGRMYIMNVDHVNNHTPFKAPIRQSNLCAEIALPTVPLKYHDDPNGEIALCTLSAINWGNIRHPSDFEKVCKLAVRGLDALLSFQDYPVKAARLSTEKYRPLGIGIVNFAYWLAKNDTTYSKPDLELIDEYAEAWSYYLIKASADIAQEKAGKDGQIDMQNLKYSDGWLPIDTANPTADGLVQRKRTMPWDGLREQIKTYGIANATLMALMPAETSALVSNSTNGIEPIRSLVTSKQSRDGTFKQVAPEIRKLKNKYDLLWSQQSPLGYLKIMAVLQRYIDQTISTNTSYNPKYYTEEQIPMSVLLHDLVTAYKMGIKTLYYFNTYDGAGEVDVPQEEDCDACRI